MAQSTQSTQYAELSRAVSRFVFGTDASGSPTAGDQLTTVNDIIRRGLRKFYTPPPLPKDNYVHIWSFLKKATTLDVRGEVSSTATTAMASTTAVIDTAATFTTNLGTSGDALVGATVTAKDVSTGTEYTSQVSSVTNATTLVVADTWNAALSSTSDTYKITNINWTLPDDFGALCGDLTYETRTSYPPLKLVSEEKIRQLRQNSGFTRTGRPKLAAVRPRTLQTTTTAGTRWEIMFWPEPDSTYTFDYRYWVALNEITASLTFPAGAIHGEAILAACMWVAQEYADPQNRQFNMRDRFIEALQASVMFDRQLHGGEIGGYNGDSSDLASRGVPFRDRVGNVTVGGVQYP